MNRVTDVVILQDSFVSLHVQLYNQLRHLILSGRWSHGSRIPSESMFAEHLKVSRSTVRLALQQSEIEGLIERIAGRGAFVVYQPMQDQESHLIAFVSHGLDSESHLLMLKGAENEARARGYQIILTNVQNQQDEIESLQRLKGEDVAGVLIWANANASVPDQRNAQSYQQVDLPMVVMDRQIYGINCDCVTSDHYNGAQALMRHLVQLGHQQVVFLTHYQVELLSVKDRYRAYCDVLQDAGLTSTAPWLIGEPGNEIRARDALRSAVNPHSLEVQQIKDYLLSADPRPTAIFALNDYLAVIATGAIKLLDLRVPDAISIAGFDDIEMAAHLEVPLTTVAQDPFMIGKRAAQRLIDRLEGSSEPTHCEYMPTQLRIRSSTAVPIRV